MTLVVMCWRRLRTGVLCAFVWAGVGLGLGLGGARTAAAAPSLYEERPSPADMTDEERLEYAKKLYIEGNEAFDLGDAATALDLWERAYHEYVPHLHTFNYNLGVVAMQTGDCVLARRYFQRFLDLVSEHPARADAARRVQQIEELGCEEALIGMGRAGIAMGGDSRLPRVEESLRVEVDHQHVYGVLRQGFSNRSDRSVEGLFSFRGGPGVEVVGFAYWNGSEKIVGEVFEKSIATKIYGRTVSRRRDPGLLVGTGDGSFRFSVFPIASGELKKVEVEYEQWLNRRGNRVELRLPVTSTDAQIDLTIRDERPIVGIDSPTHEIDVRSDGDGALRVRPTPKSAREGSPLVVQWSLSEAPGNLRAFVHRDQGHDAYLVLTLSPPQGTGAVARDLTLVLDRSKSMAGEAMMHARTAAIEAIRRVRAPDRINVVAYGDAAERLFERPQKATEAVRTEAIEFIGGLRGAGGDELAGALRAAFEGASGGRRPSTVVLLTDGGADRAKALGAVDDVPAEVRLFTVGVGSRADHPLLSYLARGHRGRFLSVPRSAQLEARLSALFERIETPAVVDLTLDAKGLDLHHVHPGPLPDLFGDDELLIATRVSGHGSLDVELRGRGRTAPFVSRARVEIPEQVRRPWVGRLWAQRRVDALLEEIELNRGGAEQIDETIQLALAYDIVTPYTAFLAMPESELMGDTASLMRNARAYKQKILDRHPDAAAIRGPGGRMTAEMDDVSDAPALTSRSEVEPNEQRDHGSPAGCASCRASDPSDGGSPWLLWVVLLLLRRRLQQDEHW